MIKETRNPVGRPPFTMQELISRFWDNTNKTRYCWLWLGRRDKDGYGEMKVKRKREYAHRFSYKIHFGFITKGMCVLHKCDNPPCVNPSHLFLGTVKDNVRDSIEKGRRAHQKLLSGMYMPHRKLSLKDVKKIVFLCKEGVSQAEVARNFGISQANVSLIVNKKRWGFV